MREGPRIWKSAVPLVSGQGARIAMLFAATTLVASSTEPADAGRFFVVLAAVRFTAPLVSLGGADGALRLAAAGRSPLGIVRRLAPPSVGISLVVAALGSVALPAATAAQGWAGAFAAVLFLLTLSAALRAWIHPTVIAAGGHGAAGLHDGLRGAGPLLGTLHGMLLGADGRALVVGYALGGLLSGLFVLVLVSIGFRGLRVPRRDADVLDRRHTMRIAVGGTLRAAYESADQLMLPLFVSLTAVRNYGLAASAAYALMAAIGAVGELALPRMYSERQPGRVVPEMRNRMLALGSALYVAAVLAAGALSWIFEEVGILRMAMVLALVLPFRAMSYLPLAELTATRRQGERNRIEIAGGVGNAIGNILLISTVGALGAAISSVVTEGWMARASARVRTRGSQGVRHLIRPISPLRVVQIANRKSPHVPAWSGHHRLVGAQIFKVASHERGFAVGNTIRDLVRAAIWGLGTVFGRHTVVVEAHGAGRAGMVSRLLPFPRIVIVHGSEVLLARGMRATFVAFVLRGADIIVVTSAATAKKVLEMAPKSEPRVRVVHPGVDWKELRTYSANESGRLMVSVRRILPLYNVAEFVRSLRAIPRESAGPLTLIHGDVRSHQPYVRETYRALTELDRTFDVDVVDRFLSKREFHRMLANHEIAVSLAESDQMSEAVLEALGVGCAVVLTDLEAYGRLRDLDHVFLVDVPVDSQEITRALEEAIKFVQSRPKKRYGTERADRAREVFEGEWGAAYTDVLGEFAQS